MSASETHSPKTVLRLFVAGQEMNSRLARNNLEKFCARLPEGSVELTVIDVLEDPEAAVEHGVMITPMLELLEPEPGMTVYGNLNDLESVLGPVLLES